MVLNNFALSGMNFALKSFNNIIIFGLLARVIGLSNFGLANYLITIITLIASVAVFGFRIQIVKEVASQTKEVDQQYLFNKVIIVCATYLLCMLVSWFYLSEIDSDVATVQLFVVCASAIFVALAGLFFSFFHAINKFHYESIALLGFTAMQIVGLILSARFEQMRYFMAFYCIGTVTMFLTTVVLFIKSFDISFQRFTESVSVSTLRDTFKSGFPFMVITSADIILGSMDVIILQRYVSGYDLGVYTAAIKLVIGLSVLAAVVFTGLLPYICKFYHTPSDNYKRNVKWLFFALILLGLLTSGTYYFIGEQANEIAFGKGFDLESSQNLSMFIGTIALFSFARHLMVLPSMFVIASGKEKERAYAISVLIVINLFVYLAVIPKHGAYGAFVVTTGINFMVAIIYIIMSYSDYTSLGKDVEKNNSYVRAN